ncbi:hypothetical protein [Rhodospirillaceae bacterium SYSU D60014]|jgi:hypothetical protein|uniref:hypothetical protein n=1 Tax=Virgifigura deserti TaxID=2268457 RepID=UPI000E66D80E
MLRDIPYKVRWIFAPSTPGRGGLYGTTTHQGATPAAAAVASAERLLNALPDEERNPAELLILSVFEEPDGENLLSAADLEATLRYHHTPLPCPVVYRPLC